MKRLVVYYSYGGHTKMIVDMVTAKKECDVLKIEPMVAYSEDYDYLVNEYQDNANTDRNDPIKKISIDLKQYDEIILGSPVWWYSIVPVVRTFLKEYDLSNKVIIPFATNAGWLGKTFKEIKKLCPNSTIKDEMNIVFTEDHLENKLVTSQKEIDKWIERL